MELFLKAFIGLFLLIGTRCSENEFDYKELGPDYWKAKIPACNGSSQSPIDINTNSAVYEKKLASINFYNYSIQIRLNLTHNGHTVVAYQSDSKPVPYIMMNVPMSGTYTMVRFNLAQFHFHWGYNDYQGSEHYFNGNKYPLELHLVHKSSSGTLAVLGFLYELNGQNNTALNNVLTAVGLINQVNSVTTATFGLSSLLPNYSVLRSNGYFRYRGSLTAPPCSQNVIWTVFKTLNPVSSSQANLVDKICLLNRDLRRINRNLSKSSKTKHRMYYPNAQSNNFGSVSSDSSESTLRSRIVQGIVDFVGIIITFSAFAIVYGVMDPKIRYYTCDQSDVSYPLLADTVPFYAVGLFGILGVLVVIILVELYNAKLFPFQSSDEDLGSRLRVLCIVLFHSISLFVFGIAVTLLLTEIGKKWAGRLRPNFIAVCNPTTLTSATCVTNGVYNSIYTGGSFCTGSASSVKEARLSFPSGHSSFSVYTMLFLVIYLQARLNTLTFRAIRPLIQVAAISAAWVVCLSRIVDYHHRGSDVIGGAILGALVALAFTLLFGRVLWDFSKKKEGDFDFRE